ncbi:hypothetical protein TRAPUB_11597 [Trametes pubescens]|uniref:Uncharacterized protein n=1 Tax=Trametes pubescens TaxID=154538 RepID=A0A1M2VVA5_TRAPU|nr:hypothetical protein TRAPUB_11989 [Trametes pubescens]OJT11853.1 hypothetical protein TRAPUB_11598 [Trametes pubescens]OJT11856.1 hypothetical protein TRAPUB_11597 [Trametes pubescens]
MDYNFNILPFNRIVSITGAGPVPPLSSLSLRGTVANPALTFAPITPMNVPPPTTAPAPAPTTRPVPSEVPGPSTTSVRMDVDHVPPLADTVNDIEAREEQEEEPSAPGGNSAAERMNDES